MVGRRICASAGLALGLAALAALQPAPARADFYDLEGRYQCLEKPGAVCYDATPSSQPPADEPAPPAADVDADAPPPEASAPATPPKGQKGKGKAKAEAAPPKPVDPIAQIAARIQAGKPAPGDLAELQKRAKASDRRALEMLAWCAFTGTGGPRDPVRAWVLYGEAAAAGSPTGRKNQAAIFQSSLTQEQRQQVLDIENSRLQHETRQN